MVSPQTICSKCHEDFMNCKCEQFHPNIIHDIHIPGHFFNIEELKALYKLIEHMYIPYEDQEAHAVINKIMRILKEHE